MVQTTPDDNKVEITSEQKQKLEEHFLKAEKNLTVGIIILVIFGLVGVFFAGFLGKNTTYIVLPFCALLGLFILGKSAFKARKKEIASGRVNKAMLNFIK